MLIKKCAYFVEKGVFGFETKKERDEFLKSPSFEFDFDSGIFEYDSKINKNTLKKIFGSYNFGPIANKKTDFKISYLQKAKGYKNSVVIDVELELNFKIYADQETFNKWDHEMIRFAGRITPNMSDSFVDSDADGFRWF